MIFVCSFVYLNALAIQVSLPNGFQFLQSLQNIFSVMIFVRSFVYLNALAIQVGLPNGFYFLQSLQNIFLVMIFVRSFVYMNVLQFKLACRMVSNFCYYLACILMRFSSPSLSSLMLFSASLLSIRRFSYLEDFITGLIDRQIDR